MQSLLQYEAKSRHFKMCKIQTEARLKIHTMYANTAMHKNNFFSKIKNCLTYQFVAVSLNLRFYQKQSNLKIQAGDGVGTGG